MEMLMKYPKIHSLWKRDSKNNNVIIPGEYSKPEFENIRRWHISEKVHGVNIRVIYKNQKLKFRGKTDKTKISEKLLTALNEIFNVDVFKLHFQDKDVIFFGEGCGGYIQDYGKYYGKNCFFVLFDVKIESWWLKQQDVQQLAEMFSIPYAPCIGMHWSIDSIINYVKQYPDSILAKRNKKKIMMEGIVARSEPLMRFRNGKPIMFKLKCDDYKKICQP